MRIFGREPALVIAAISAGLSLLVTFNVGLSGEQAGALNAVVLAVLALVTRGQVSPTTRQPAPLSGV